MRRRTLILLSTLIAVALVLGVVVIYFGTTHRMIYVPSGSMMNTVIPGDRFFARKFSGEVKRGHLIVFQYPGDSNYYLARVVGLPNETVDIRETSVYINRRQVIEQRVMVESAEEDAQLKEVSIEGKGRYRVFYVAGTKGESERVVSDTSVGPHVVPAGHYFVMGDNRDFSEDSRWRGTVPRELIWGEAYMIYFSTDVRTDEFRWDRLFKSIH